MSMTRRYSENPPSREDVDALTGPTVVEFGAPWCGHCIAAQAPSETAFAGHADVRHLKIEDGPGRRLGRSFRVRLWPTLVFLRDGEEIARLVRPTSQDEIERAFEQLKKR